VDGKLVQKLNTTAIVGSPVTRWALCPACFPPGSSSEHTVRIERVLESDYGTTAFHGISAAALLDPPTPPTRRIEYIGDSIMSGDACMERMDDPSATQVNGQWTTPMCANDTVDFNFEKVDSSWHSWGPVMAREWLDADYMLTSKGGIGLIFNAGEVPENCTSSTFESTPNCEWPNNMLQVSLYRKFVLAICFGDETLTLHWSLSACCPSELRPGTIW
jgi:hypothetical protein